jgi:hypothetical protein
MHISSTILSYQSLLRDPSHDMPVSGPVRPKMHHFSLTNLPDWVQIITLAIWPHQICSGLTWTRLVRDNNGVRHQEPSTWSITQKDDQTVAMTAGELAQQINVAGDRCGDFTGWERFQEQLLPPCLWTIATAGPNCWTTA